jgi:hypothetical protein
MFKFAKLQMFLEPKKQEHSATGNGCNKGQIGFTLGPNKILARAWTVTSRYEEKSKLTLFYFLRQKSDGSFGHGRVAFAAEENASFNSVQ